MTRLALDLAVPALCHQIADEIQIRQRDLHRSHPDLDLRETLTNAVVATLEQDKTHAAMHACSS